MKMNTVWLDKCFKAAEMLYGVFPFGVLERLYGGKLGRDETIKAAEGKFDYIDSNLDEFEALGYAPGYFTPIIYEDGEEYEKYKAQGDKMIEFMTSNGQETRGCSTRGLRDSVSDFKGWI